MVGLPLSLSVEPWVPVLGVESPPYTPHGLLGPPPFLSCPARTLPCFSDQRSLPDLTFCLAISEAPEPIPVILRPEQGSLPLPPRDHCGFSLARSQELG